MTNEQQALAEMPIWLVIVLALVGGVSGEMWRADKDGARGWALLRRLALRSGACIVCGVSAMMLMIGAIHRPCSPLAGGTSVTPSRLAAQRS